MWTNEEKRERNKKTKTGSSMLMNEAAFSVLNSLGVHFIVF